MRIGIKSKTREGPSDLYWRFTVLKVFFFIIGAAIISRLFSLQILEHKEYAAQAERQQNALITLPSKRGTIYFQDKAGNLQAAAINTEWPGVAVTPNTVKDKSAVTDILSSILNISSSTISTILNKENDPFEIVARKIPQESAASLREAIQTTDTKGISIFQEFRRSYPGNQLAARVLGFVNFENDVEKGQYGLERLYNSELSGEKSISSGKNTKDTLLSFGKSFIDPPESGVSLVLTIDPNIQQVAETELGKVVEKWNAVSGAILVMDPKTGKILAMNGYPSFDPNRYSDVHDLSIFKNPIVDSQYELGSIIKPITMAAGINEKKITPTTTYVDKGEIVYGTFHIRNSDLEAHGTQTMTQVLEKSLNTGAIFVENLLGKDTFLSYLEKFGFGKKTGILFPNEAKGDMSNLSHKRDADYATASFGQGIAITPIQIATAVSAIANGGHLVTPYLVDSLRDDSGNIQTIEPQIREEVISKETSEAVTRMLVSAVMNGFQNSASVPGYFIAGKTGTAQVPNKNKKGYDPDRVIHSFVGYAPAFNPKFLIFIQMNEPKGIRFAASSLTPTFHQIAKYILNYYQVPFDIPQNSSK